MDIVVLLHPYWYSGNDRQKLVVSDGLMRVSWPSRGHHYTVPLKWSGLSCYYIMPFSLTSGLALLVVANVKRSMMLSPCRSVIIPSVGDAANLVKAGHIM